MSEQRVRTIELVYFDGCPHVSAARAAVDQAVAGISEAVERVDRRQDDPDTPDWAERLPSPTVLVDGENVVGDVEETEGRACAGEPPSVEAIRRAFDRTG